MRFKNNARCCYERFVRQTDYDYFITLFRTPLALLNFCTIESRRGSGHLHRPNSVKSYETNSLGGHLGSFHKFCMSRFKSDMTLILHFRTSQEKRFTKRLLSFHRVADDAVIRVYDEPGNVIETHEHAGDFKEC